MARKTAKLTREEELALDNANLAEVEMEALPPEGELPEDVPAMYEPAWNDYVMRQFTDNELDPKGNPMVHGLRRVALRLLGPVLRSESEVLQPPVFAKAGEGVGVFCPTVVRHVLEIMWEKDTDTPYRKIVSDVADVYLGNTDKDFSLHPTATAATRAEGRCLRKALNIKNVASEEMRSVPAREEEVDGFITRSQLTFLDIMCSRNAIDLIKFINSGPSGKKYARVEDIPSATAEKMNKVLSGYQAEPHTIPEGLKGYNPDWRSE